MQNNTLFFEPRGPGQGPAELSAFKSLLGGLYYPTGISIRYLRRNWRPNYLHSLILIMHVSHYSQSITTVQLFEDPRLSALPIR